MVPHESALKPLQMDLISMKRPGLAHDAQHSLNSLNSLDTPTAKLWNLGHSNRSNASMASDVSSVNSPTTPKGLRSPPHKLPMETLNLTLLPTLVSQSDCLSDSPSVRSQAVSAVSPDMNQSMYVSPGLESHGDAAYSELLVASMEDPVLSKFIEMDPLGVGVVFDRYAVRSGADDGHDVVCLFSSSGLEAGCHEFTVEIVECDVYKMEIGIVGRCDISGDMLSSDGVIASESLKQRAVYGNELCSNSNYYVSINEDNKRRCYKDLASSVKIGWCSSDVIKVRVDLNRSKIKFMRNGSNVRKALSLQPKKVYFPCITFTGNCRFRVIS